jgi:hypothetical protein
MLEVLFVILVVLGFACMLFAALPPPAPPRMKWPYFTALGWALWLIASIIWAITYLGLHAISAHVGQ